MTSRKRDARTVRGTSLNENARFNESGDKVEEFDEPAENVSSNNQQISTMDILTSGSKSIRKECVLQYTKQGHKNVEFDVKKKCKLLKFSSEWKYDDVLMEIARLDCKVFENLFIFIIELDDSDRLKSDAAKREDSDKIKHLIITFAPNRPLVLQLTLKGDDPRVLYYKDVKGAQFLKIERQSSNLEAINNFSSFIWSFFNAQVEKFEELMLTTFPCDENSLLILRFIRTLELSTDFFDDLALRCGSYCSRDDLIAALDIPFEHVGNVEKSETTKFLSYVIYYKDSAQSVLFNALEQSNNDICNFLVDHCKLLIEDIIFDHKVEISTTAYETNQIGFLCDLIQKCDFPFPKDLNLQSIEKKQILKKIITNRNDLHQAIKNKNIKKIDMFINANKGINTAFDIENNSALYVALNEGKSSKNYEAFFHLRANSFQAIEFNNYQDVIVSTDDLNIAKKYARSQRIQNVNAAFSSEKNSVLKLSIKSLIHNNKNINKETRETYHEKIRQWYEEINKVEEARLQFKVAATADDLKVVFDFESDSSTHIDFSETNTNGVTYPNLGLIMIGAEYKSCITREQKVKSVMAHEINHYVMRIVFENEEKPYFKEDKAAEKLFKEITEEIRVLVSLSDDGCYGIISSVFTDYNEDQHEVELIVRVLHILVEFSNDIEKIYHLREKFRRLFDFHRDHVSPHLLKFLNTNRDIVRKFNESAAVLSEILSLDFQFDTLKDTNFMTEKQLTIVTSNQPKLLFLNIGNNLFEKYGSLFDAKNIFVTLTDFNNSSELEKVLAVNPELNIFVDCSRGIEERLKHVVENKDTNFIFVVSNESDNEKLTKIINEMKLKSTIDISWKDLSMESRKAILQTKINIRNHTVSFLDLFSKSDEADSQNMAHENFSKMISDQLLNLLINKSDISINTDFNPEKAYGEFDMSFVPRTFNKRIKVAQEVGNIKETKNIPEAELLKDVKNKKFVLVSDMAGAGKTWALQSAIEALEKSNRSCWISYVDLKQYIRAFNFEAETSIEFSNFLSKKILEPKNNFESDIFIEMYKKGKTYIFFDGFDEIATECVEFVTKLIQSFEFNGGNQLWIATRDYFEIDLQKELGIDTAYKLELFTEQDEINLITSSWILSDAPEVRPKTRKKLDIFVKNHKNYKSYQQRAKILNSKIKSLKESSVGIPQFYKILVEVSRYHKNDLIESTIFKVYDKYVTIQFKRWSNKKGEKNSDIQSKYYLNFHELHIFFAMRGLYPEIKIFYDLFFDPASWQVTEIIDCGFLRKKDEKYFFVHETFQEFFAAQFIVRFLTRPNDRYFDDFCKFFVDFLTIPKYKIIRVFLNEAFSEQTLRDKMELHLSKVSDWFYENVTEINSFIELFEKDNVNFENLKNFMKKILDFGKYDNKKKILVKSFETSKNSKDYCPKLTEIVFSALSIKDAKDLVNIPDKSGNNFLHLLVMNSQPDVVEKNLIVIKKHFSTGDYAELLNTKGQYQRNVLFIIVRNSKFLKVLQLLWKEIKESTEPNNLVKHMYDADDDIFHMAATYSTGQMFEFLVEEFENVVSREKFKETLNVFGFNDRNLLQLAARENFSLDLHKSLWKCIEKYFKAPEILDMLNYYDKEKNSFFHLIVRWSNIEIVKFSWEKIKKYIVKHEDQTEFLRRKGNNIGYVQRGKYNGVEVETWINSFDI